MYAINDDDPTLLPNRESHDWPQVAEILHATDGRVRTVTALQDCPHGLFKAGEVVYISKGPVP